MEIALDRGAHWVGFLGFQVFEFGFFEFGFWNLGTKSSRMETEFFGCRVWPSIEDDDLQGQGELHRRTTVASKRRAQAISLCSTMVLVGLAFNVFVVLGTRSTFVFEGLGFDKPGV
uniref:Uncharacterized protein n=1 Tax=Cannabis sativa TaxID=3483 RepID=A0A803PHD6_CANSA